jgi:hypothetical protein
MNEDSTSKEVVPSSFFYYPLDLISRDEEQRSYYSLFGALLKVMCRNPFTSCTRENKRKIKR